MSDSLSDISRAIFMLDFNRIHSQWHSFRFDAHAHQFILLHTIAATYACHKTGTDFVESRTIQGRPLLMRLVASAGPGTTSFDAAGGFGEPRDDLF